MNSAPPPARVETAKRPPMGGVRPGIGNRALNEPANQPTVRDANARPLEGNTLSTNTTNTVLCARLTGADGDAVQIAIWVEGHVTKAWIRSAPSGEASRPRWQDVAIPASLWPGKTSGAAWRGAAGTLQGFLSRKMPNTGGGVPVQVEGMWPLDMSEEDRRAIAEGESSNSLKTRIARALEEPNAPRTHMHDSLSKACEWLVTGPVVALAGGDTSAYTTSVLKPPSAAVVAPPTVEGIALTDGKTTFVPRLFWGGLTDVDFLRQARGRGIYTLLAGPPGTGKSALVEAAFIDSYREADLVFKEDALVVGTEDTTVQDLIGGMAQDEDGIFRFKPGKAIKCALAGVPLFVDEALLIDPRVLSVLYSLIDGRGILPLPEEYKYESPDGTRNAVHAAEGFYIVFAGNPDVPGAVISEALASRCVLKPEYLTDYDTAATLLGTVHDDIVTVARNMETKRQEGEVLWAPQMRDLLGYRDVAEAFGTEVALSNLLANCASDSDREVLADVIARTLGVSNIRAFRI